MPSEWDLRWLVFTDDGIQTSNLRKVPRTIAEMRALEESLLAMNNQYTQQNQTEPRNVADSKKVKQKSAKQVRKQQTSSAKALRKLETTAKKEGWISLDSKIKHKESMRIYNLPENVEKRRLGRIENEKRFIEQRKDAARIAVEVLPLTNYLRSEDKHQDRLSLYPNEDCHIAPELLHKYKKKPK